MEQIDDKVHAFLLQFAGDRDDIRKKFGIYYYYDGDPVGDMIHTGLFGVLDALMDLGLTGKEIVQFYIHGRAEGYNNPRSFTEGIINMIYGMSKDEMKKEYERCLRDETIEKIPSPNINSRMLLSFCYDKDDTYEFIPDKNKLNTRFSSKYKPEHYCVSTEEEFQKIDGKLFRAVRFLVRQGYDFPEIESLTDEQIKNIVFKQTNGEKVFVLNKEYAREVSNNLLFLDYFLKKYDYKFLNPESIFDQQCNSITLVDPNGKQTVISRSYLELDTDKYSAVLNCFPIKDFDIVDVISICDKRIKDIAFNFIDREGVTHNITINRDRLVTISREFVSVIKEAYNQRFMFLDNDNLFDMSQRLLKIADCDGKEYLVVREQLSGLLKIIIQCKNHGFNVNLSQLFDINQSDVELFDRTGRKSTVNRDRIIYMMNVFSLLIRNNYSFNDYRSLFDENQPYIVSYDNQGIERLISRKQIDKIIWLQGLSDEKDLTDSDKDLKSMLRDDNSRKKLFEWLPYTAKKWIPSSAVIMKIPAERSYEYFHNNNHARLKSLKDIYQPRNYEEMEGIVSLGYILGLFDSRESVSKRAVEYIINYFVNKGVTTDELHKIYGAIDLRGGYNKNFADFFMRHYASNSEAFIEPDVGTNMTGELFERFDEVLESRPEKRIKTNTLNKLLIPLDAMAAITTSKIDWEILGEKANDERYIKLVELLTKFGAGKNEIEWAMKLYEEALAIDEQKVNIPCIEDLNPSLIKFTSHLKSDPQAFISGRKTNCCSRYGGYAEDRLTHTITDLNWRYITFTSQNRTYFDGLVWYDSEQRVVCIDNVEGQFSDSDKKDDKSVAMMFDAVSRYANGIYCTMRKLGIPCTKVNVGKDQGTASWEIFRYARQQGLIQEDSNPCDYPARNAITTDAKEQFTITGEKMLRYRGRY